MPSKLRPFLRLLRVGTLFSPAADVVAGLCVAGLPWSAGAVRGAVASVLLYAAGMVLNDHADRREDAVNRPERPIPAGQIRAGRALALGAVLMTAALALAPWRAYWGALAVLVVLYDYVLKRRPGVGAVAMGSLRALNLLAGAAAATEGVPGDPVLLGAAAAYGLYIAAVTILGVFEDAPRVPARAIVGVQAVPPLCACLALLSLRDPWPAAAIGIALALVFSLRVRRQGARWAKPAIRASMTWLLLGTMVYTSLLCLGSGRWPESACIALAIVPARWISRRISLT